MATGLCPTCLAEHKLNSRGALPRHGFSARNVRHGMHQGYHTGGCPAGTPPIGTRAGNDIALRNALINEQEAVRLRALPALTINDAHADAMREGQDSKARSLGTAWARVTIATAEWATPESLGRSYSGWFGPLALRQRLDRMTRARDQRATAMDAFAAALREEVRKHPTP